MHYDYEAHKKINILAKSIGKKFRACQTKGCCLGRIDRYTAKERSCDCHLGIVLEDIEN
jgi:hypothetical protein